MGRICRKNKWHDKNYHRAYAKGSESQVSEKVSILHLLHQLLPCAHKDNCRTGFLCNAWVTLLCTCAYAQGVGKLLDKNGPHILSLKLVLPFSVVSSWIPNRSSLDHSCYSLCEWENWGTEESGIISQSHSARFLFCIPSIAFKLVFTFLPWTNLEIMGNIFLLLFPSLAPGRCGLSSVNQLFALFAGHFTCVPVGMGHASVCGTLLKDLLRKSLVWQVRKQAGLRHCRSYVPTSMQLSWSLDHCSTRAQSNLPCSGNSFVLTEAEM